MASRTSRALILALVISKISAPAPSGQLRGVSLAVPCAAPYPAFLIFGPEANDERVGEFLSQSRDKLHEIAIAAAGEPAIGFGEYRYEINPQVFEQLALDHRAGFVPGAVWHVYPGSGPMVKVIVQNLILTGHGNGVQHVSAVAHIVNRNDADRIAAGGGVYLALPGEAVPPVMATPLVPETADRETVRLLFDRARAIVTDENWQVVTPVAEISTRIREINGAFLARNESWTSETRAWRLTQPGRQPAIQFIEAVWLDESRGLPLFAAEAIVQGPRTILSFDDKKAEFMRMGEFEDNDWHLNKEGRHFLAAWRIGGGQYVLTARWGYEGYSVDLRQLDSKEGLLKPIYSFGE
jgi:hypothetical protein